MNSNIRKNQKNEMQALVSFAKYGAEEFWGVLSRTHSQACEEALIFVEPHYMVTCHNARLASHSTL
jgi:hypothetical protein